MADFKKAFEKTMEHEGGYAFDPDDAGGETYKGISRRYHPEWLGWQMIAVIRASTYMKEEESDQKVFFSALDQSEELRDNVMSIYREHYWDRFQGDLIPSQRIANELFDTAVNMGVGRAVGFLQEALNLLNRNEKNYHDITEDGLFGSQTLQSLDAHLILEDKDYTYLLRVMNTLQGMHYINYMRSHPEQEKYARGWLKRII